MPEEHLTGNPVFDYRAADRRAADAKQALLLKGGAFLFLASGIACFFVPKDSRPITCWIATSGIVVFAYGVGWGYFWRKRMRAEFREKFGPEIRN
jgi:hypothetical protein